MARPLYSAQFIVYTEAAPNYQFEVPAGFVAVVREFTLWTELGATVGVLYFQNSGSAPAVTFARTESVGALAYDHWEGRVVVPAGGIITFDQFTAGVGAQAYVGGYLLSI